MGISDIRWSNWKRGGDKMLKSIGIVILVLAAVGIIVTVVLIATESIENAVNQSHRWEEQPDEAEKEART